MFDNHGIAMWALDSCLLPSIRTACLVHEAQVILEGRSRTPVPRAKSLAGCNEAGTLQLEALQQARQAAVRRDTDR